MSRNRLVSLAILAFICIFSAAGCGGKATQAPPVDPAVKVTELYNTVIAGFTQTAEAYTPTPSPTITSSPTKEIVPPTPTAAPPTPTVEPTATTPVEPTATTAVLSPTAPPVSSGVRLWWDDFEGEKMWYSGAKEGSYAFEFVKGAYRIYNNLLAAIVWSIRGENYANIRVEVDAMKQKGPKDGYYGLICRYVDSQNYYALVIANNSTFGVVKMEKGEINFIQKGDIPDNILKAKDEYNRLRADCIGTSLILYVNGKKVGEAQDKTFASGDVGIGAGNQLEAAGIDVVFDNFEIWQP
jgi:hypothetical protein